MIEVNDEKVMKIDRKATNVSIPSFVASIGKFACAEGSLTVLDLKNTHVLTIEKYAFSNCHHLAKVMFPSCLEEICESSFQYCHNLNYISFESESRLRKIGNFAFSSCNFDVLNPHLEFIGDYAFPLISEIADLRHTRIRYLGQFALGFPKYICFPSSIKLISILNNLCEKADVDESHPTIRKDGCGYYFSNGIILERREKLKYVLIRRGVETIAKNCFNDSKLVSVTIPSSVKVIDKKAFYNCKALKRIRFLKDSQLNIINIEAFSQCESLKKVIFPKSLKIVKSMAFNKCTSLEKVVFPHDSQLERIEDAFSDTSIQHLSLPPSVREIIDISFYMEKLKSMFVSNDLYQSNEEGTAIFSRDGRELVCVIKSIDEFNIPDGVRVIKKGAFYLSQLKGKLIIPSSVEVIEENALKCNHELETIEFAEGSRLKTLGQSVFLDPKSIIINNENYMTMENGVIISVNPYVIIFVPRHLTEIEIPSGVEVIYSYAFYSSQIRHLKLPQSLKRICSRAFDEAMIQSIEFNGGIEINDHAFCYSHISTIKFTVTQDQEYSISNSAFYGSDYLEEIICPVSLIPAIAHVDLFNISLRFIEDY